MDGESGLPQEDERTPWGDVFGHYVPAEAIAEEHAFDDGRIARFLSLVWDELYEGDRRQGLCLKPTQDTFTAWARAILKEAK